MPSPRRERRVLILGSAGQVGRALQRDLAPLGTVVARARPARDITNPDAVRSLFASVQPELVVNAAAYTAVDKAEADPAVAQSVNATAVGVVAEECRKARAFLVHYSTEYVFDGTQSTPYAPDDPPNPLSVYGRTKLAGEQALFQAGGAAVLLRTSWVFGLHGGNFVKTMLRLARERDALRVVADQFGQPTPAELISSVTALLLHRICAEGVPAYAPQRYHLASNRPTSWHGFACTIIERATALGFVLRATPNRVAAIDTAQYPLPARRPANSRLDVSKLESDFGLQMPDWLPYLNRMLEDLRRGEQG
jgi:dTDP-4-dehydrorhamnose reductase